MDVRALLAKGYPVTVYNRTKAKAQASSTRRRLGRLARAVAEQSDIVFAIVGFPNDVRDVFFADAGVLAGARAGTISST